MTCSEIRSARVLCGILTVALALAGDATVAGAREEQDAAKKAFRAGRRLYERSNFVGAIRYFRRSNELRPHFLTLCNIARCHERLGEMVSASQSYRRCLARGGARSPHAARIHQALRNVDAQLAVVTIQSPGATPGKAFVDGKPVGTTPVTVPMTPGVHEIEVYRSASNPAAATIKVGAGETTEVVLGGIVPRPTPAPKKPTTETSQVDEPPRRSGKKRLSPTWFWTGASLTAALAIAATILGVLALQANSDYEDEPTEFGYNRVMNRRLATNVTWGLSAGFAATTATLLFFTDFGSSPAAASEDARAYVFGLQGTF